MTSLCGAFFSFLRSLLAVALLFGFCYGALVVRKHFLLNVLDSVNTFYALKKQIFSNNNNYYYNKRSTCISYMNNQAHVFSLVMATSCLCRPEIMVASMFCFPYSAVFLLPYLTTSVAVPVTL